MICGSLTVQFVLSIFQGRREQMNQKTSYLDFNVLYGSNDIDARRLRAFIGGKIHVNQQMKQRISLPELWRQITQFTKFRPLCTVCS